MITNTGDMQGYFQYKNCNEYFVLWCALVKYLDYTMSRIIYRNFFSFAVSLHAENDMPQFRGVLIQARLMADDTNRVGVFAVSPDSMTTTRLSSCPTDTVSYSS